MDGRRQIRQLAAGFMAHQACRANFLSRTGWELVFGMLFLQLGLDGTHRLAMLSRSRHYDASKNTASIEFEMAVSNSISLKAGRLERGRLTFELKLDAMSVGADKIRLDDVAELMASLEAQIDPHASPEDSRLAWHAFYLQIDPDIVPATLRHIDVSSQLSDIVVYGSMSALPFQYRHLLSLEAKRDVRYLASIVCAYMLTPDATTEYLAFIANGPNGKKRCRQIKDSIKAQLKAPAKRDDRLAYVHSETRKYHNQHTDAMIL